jgi:hypothetical protein
MTTQSDAAGDPDDGHTFAISVRSRSSYAIVGEAHHHDADWMGERPITLTVRAWSLPAAMQTAARASLNDWTGWGEDDDATETWPPAEERINAVLALHHPASKVTNICILCAVPCPCPTARAATA